MQDTFDEAAWRANLEAAREEAADYYLNSFNWRGSPVPEGFEGPRYFPPNPSWRVEATLDREAPGTGMRVQLPTSIGDLRDFDVYGTFRFTVDGQEHRLSAYRAVPEHPGYDYLFLPFKDATTGRETYGAGRYIDVPRRDDSSYVLDFNEAYSPSCAYSPRYNCPYPPSQNTLTVRVEAGEMVPVEH
ncbi:MAG: DUF1684 domain-containing protein [Chloroflexota bacterium]|nr:DUF1684 domain-containing protein [Chloroflexota bacterium]MDQ5865844.1 DUF1684 domain-containing protein [Chloroflexota bacterium]